MPITHGHCLTKTEKDNNSKSIEQGQSRGILYTSLEVIKLIFLEGKSRYVCCIFANFIFTFETKS